MHPPAHRPYQHGFTLVELAIVLVIIGLLIGGVLVGRDLIHTAEIRAEIKQITDYQTAFNTFQLKYDCIPGDCTDAVKFFGATDKYGNAVNNGNGNGLIDTSNGSCYDDDGSVCIGGNTWDVATEMYGAIQQLSMARLITFSPSSPYSYIPSQSRPAIKLNHAAAFFFGASYSFNGAAGARNPDLTPYRKGTNIMWLVDCGSLAVGYGNMGAWDNNCAVFTASDLQAIDSKFDDGMPLSGKFYGFGGYNSNNDCLNTGSTPITYKTTNTTPQCQATYVIN